MVFQSLIAVDFADRIRDRGSGRPAKNGIITKTPRLAARWLFFTQEGLHESDATLARRAVRDARRDVAGVPVATSRLRNAEHGRFAGLPKGAL